MASGESALFHPRHVFPAPVRLQQHQQGWYELQWQRQRLFSVRFHQLRLISSAHGQGSIGALYAGRLWEAKLSKGGKREASGQWRCKVAGVQENVKDEIWEVLKMEAMEQSEAEPYLASFLYATVITHPSLERSLAFHLANKLANTTLLSTQLLSLFSETFAADSGIQEAIREDMKAFRERDPACTSYVHGMLNFKGFLACQAHRVAHRLWRQNRIGLALALQNRISEVFQVDIHPGAQIGKGMFIDHATGVVVGETAVVGDNVSILHHVTLGGTGNRCRDRHPKVGSGVLIGAGATLLGPIKVGDGAKIGACTLVLIDVPCHSTAVGVPARIIPSHTAAVPDACNFPGQSMDHTIVDYVI